MYIGIWMTSNGRQLLTSRWFCHGSCAVRISFWLHSSKCTPQICVQNLEIQNIDFGSLRPARPTPPVGHLLRTVVPVMFHGPKQRTHALRPPSVCTPSALSPENQRNVLDAAHEPAKMIENRRFIVSGVSGQLSVLAKALKRKMCGDFKFNTSIDWLWVQGKFTVVSEWLMWRDMDEFAIFSIIS